VFGNRNVLALTVGYTATIWGTAGLRQWIVVFLLFCVANQGGDATQGWSMLIIGTLSCSPFQAAGTLILACPPSYSAWPPLGKAGGTIMKRRLIML
jgi:hypothetical protein